MIHFTLPVIRNKEKIQEALGLELSLFLLDCTFQGNCFEAKFECPDEEIADQIVNLLYGPEDGSREDNRFWIYGE